MTTLPRDTDNNTIQALRLAPARAHQLTANATSSRNTIAFDGETRVVSVYATAPVFINFGDETVVATNGDHFFPDGLYYDFAIGGGKTLHHTHISVLAADGEAQVYISEKR